MTDFIECTSLNISYDVMGIATVSYTVVHNTPTTFYYPVIEAGGQIFRGYVASASMNPIPNTTWYESQITMIATTD